MDLKTLLLLPFLLFALNTYAQDAPPIPSGIVCDVNSGATTLNGCENWNEDLLHDQLAALTYNGTLCYSNVATIFGTLDRRWVDSQYFAGYGSYQRFAYLTGVLVMGTNYATVGTDPYPCLWTLPVVLDPISMMTPLLSSTPKAYIAESSSLSCPGNSSAVYGPTFTCVCPNGQIWDGDPWSDIPIPGYNPTCEVPSLAQGGPTLSLTVQCSNGNCNPDGRATFVATSTSPVVDVTFPFGSTPDKVMTFITRGCCTKVPLTWSVFRRIPGSWPTTFQSKVPASPGSAYQIHVMNLKDSKSAVTLYSSVH